MKKKKSVLIFHNKQFYLRFLVSSVSIHQEHAQWKQIVAFDYLLLPGIAATAAAATDERGKCANRPSWIVKRKPHQIEYCFASVCVRASQYTVYYALINVIMCFGSMERVWVCIVCRVWHNCSIVCAVKWWDMNNTGTSSRCACVWIFSWCRMLLLCYTHKHCASSQWCIVWDGLLILLLCRLLFFSYQAVAVATAAANWVWERSAQDRSETETNI